MLSRRSALRLAAAVAAANAAPFAVSPEDARAMFAAPLASPAPLVPTAPAGGTWDAGPEIYDPAAFATEAIENNDWPDLLDHVAATKLAAYRQARAALFDALPVLREAGFGHPIHALDEAVHGIIGEAYTDGLRTGATVEHVRQALLGPVRLCRRCQGVGALRGGHADDEWPTDAPAEPCPACGGRGTVATPAPVLAVD
ncbi:MAG: hypothetical protein M3Q10_03130 [Chloroflexota bacterium]|nr:hypothetical protein [Chloroflexota bacterium]